MAVLNVRVDDHVRDRLRELADLEGVSLSEFVRDLVLGAVFSVSENENDVGDLAPNSLPPIDRQVLSLLHRILARVLPEDSNDADGNAESQLELAKVLEEGFAGEYWMEVAGLREELSKRDCHRVSEILQMFRVCTYSMVHLEREGFPVAKELAIALEFRGFDHNDPLEAHMASYVRFQMRDDDRWSELRPQVKRNDDGNSHHPVLAAYTRMVTEYRKIMDGRERGLNSRDYLLGKEELAQIAAAGVHPSNRDSREFG